MDSLNYYPEDKELFSVTGCKRVAQKVNLYVASERLRHQPDSPTGTAGETTVRKKKKPEDEFWTFPMTPLSFCDILLWQQI